MTDPKILTEILDRLGRLEVQAARLRVGEITDRNPLSVQLGGATDEDGNPIAHEGVRAVGHVNDGDKVATLFSGNDVLVLGRLGRGMVSGATHVFGSGATYVDVVIAHDLGVVPRVVVATIGEGANAGLNVGVMAKDADGFTLRLRHIDALGWPGAGGGGGVWVYWLALGE
jgi:hypothetical protein